jgi:hypothetical protein
MADYEIPKPEPKEIDSKKWLEWKDVLERATLKGHPYSAGGANERCDNCLYYLDVSEEISYCWHPELRILVGGDWWCQWWEEIPEED